jgi:hypothetical protein
MPQRNGSRSSSGRSAIARTAMFSGTGKTNSMMPSVLVKTSSGSTIRTSYFGGMKKGGAPPSATGFMVSFGQRMHASAGLAFPASNPNLLYTFRTSYGPRPFGHSA